MKFFDECVVKLVAGNGGDGFVDFIKQKPNIPCGGSGGNGGSIFFVGSTQENTLLNISAHKEYRAHDGIKGKFQNSGGQNGKDLVLRLPLGTKVFVNDRLVAKIINQNKYLIAQGGKGGRGNALYEGPRNTQKNHTYEKGQLGSVVECRLELDTLADVGFVGKPSAGKSTILSVISNAKPKIASYDFTTLKPQLGLVWVNKEKSFVAVDLPGLIARNSINNSIEEETLKIISKCKAIAYVIDFGIEDKNPIQDFFDLKKELKNYSIKLGKLPIVVIANKMDKPFFYKKLKDFKKINPDQEVVRISALTKKNIKELKYRIFNILNS